MIRVADLIRFDRKTDNGRTEPLRVTVATADGEEHEAIMKLSSGAECSIEGLANEMLGSLLAADLGFPVNEPFLVQIAPDFAAIVPDIALRNRLLASSPVAFASMDAGKQWRRWSPSDKVRSGQIGLALAVLSFDAFIGNNDRSPINANLLVKDQSWRLIDHESAFRFRPKLFPRCEPWKTGNLELLKRYGEDSEHIFTKQLAGRDDLDFTAIRTKWADLSDARLAQYEATLPEEWEEFRPIFAQAISHLKQVRDQIDNCIEELKRVLS
ncbi:HipA family kinase [Rhizobium sp. M1]|uniref:HipA family kinase n=1 Tax=Rhizobium sp. M1 TaxID=2035453 RepID=UPI000BE862E0|nr:HipA family kinase [Rhizobium sp. M1]PDT12928.1 hypothetical protein CO655_03370 [Rhizobium sp. M1]